jgi:hypothetical protein
VRRPSAAPVSLEAKFSPNPSQTKTEPILQRLKGSALVRRAFDKKFTFRLTKAAEGRRTPGRWRAVATSILSAMLFVSRLASAQQPITNDSPVQFRAVDIYIDSKDKALAAYQLTFSVANGGAKIVGIEGGDRPAFAEPPYYDPKAMQQERVIIAAFSTNAVNALPTGKTRVATIHLQLNSATQPEFNLKLQAAADADGNRIKAETSVEERKAK